MEEKQKLIWTVWFRPEENGWWNILARRSEPMERPSGKGRARQHLHLAWNGERFSGSSELAAFEKFPEEERTCIFEQIEKAKSVGWLG